MKILNQTMKLTAGILVLFSFLVFTPTLTTPIYAATSPDLGTASTYSILAGSEVTNTGATTISGNVGISPGTVSPNYTGFGTVTLGGTIHDADGSALTAMGDKDTAYANLASQGCTTDYGGGTEELAGKTLVPGVYCAGEFDLSSGTLTLNGNNSDVWIFKSTSSLIITGSSAKVVFTGGGQPCNVWWRVVSTATLGAGSSFVGNILSGTAITLADGASLNGRALAGTAEVTLVGNSITGPTCEAAAASSSSGSTSSDYSVPPCIDDVITNVPIIIESKRVSPTSVFVSWGPYTGTDTFNVRYGFENGKWLYNTDVTGFSTTLNSLPANQPIWIEIAEKNNCSIGTYGMPKLVGGPSLPNTGFAPQKNTIPWYIPWYLRGIFNSSYFN